jgi:hypothetical protein
MTFSENALNDTRNRNGYAENGKKICCERTPKYVSRIGRTGIHTSKYIANNIQQRSTSYLI